MASHSRFEFSGFGEDREKQSNQTLQPQAARGGDSDLQQLASAAWSRRA
jgi:hypothetical protein